MKKIILTAITAAFVAGCTENDVSPSTTATASSIESSLQKVSLTDLKTEFTAELQSLNGEKITQMSQLAPNSEYKIILKGVTAFNQVVRKYDGFEFIDHQPANELKSILSDRKAPSFRNTFLIKPEQMSTPLYISFFPLRTINNSLYKEHAKSFLLASE